MSESTARKQLKFSTVAILGCWAGFVVMDTYPVLFPIPQNHLSCLVIARRLFVGEQAFRYGILRRCGFNNSGTTQLDLWLGKLQMDFERCSYASHTNHQDYHASISLLNLCHFCLLSTRLISHNSGVSLTIAKSCGRAGRFLTCAWALGCRLTDPCSPIEIKDAWARRYNESNYSQVNISSFQVH